MLRIALARWQQPQQQRRIEPLQAALLHATADRMRAPFLLGQRPLHSHSVCRAQVRCDALFSELSSSAALPPVDAPKSANKRHFTSRHEKRDARQAERRDSQPPSPSAYTATHVQSVAESVSRAPAQAAVAAKGETDSAASPHVGASESSPWPRSKRDFAPALVVGMRSAERGNGHTGLVLKAMLKDPMLLASMSPPAARWMMCWLFYAQKDFNRLQTKQMQPPEWMEPVTWDPRMMLRDADLLPMFAWDIVNRTDQLCANYKAHERHRIWLARQSPPADETAKPPSVPKPSDDEVRIAVRSMYVLLRGLYDSHVIQYFERDLKLPNSGTLVDYEYAGGNQRTLTPPRIPMDPRVFPHLQGPAVQKHPTKLLVRTIKVMLKHFDLFIWPPDASPALAAEESERQQRHVRQAQQWLAVTRDMRWKMRESRLARLERVQAEIASAKTLDAPPSVLQPMQAKLALLAKADRLDEAAFDRCIYDLESIMRPRYLQNNRPNPSSLYFVAWMELLSNFRNLAVIRPHLIQFFKFGTRSHTASITRLVCERPKDVMGRFVHTPTLSLKDEAPIVKGGIFAATNPDTGAAAAAASCSPPREEDDDVAEGAAEADGDDPESDPAVDESEVGSLAADVEEAEEGMGAEDDDTPPAQPDGAAAASAVAADATAVDAAESSVSNLLSVDDLPLPSGLGHLDRYSLIQGCRSREFLTLMEVAAANNVASRVGPFGGRVIHFLAQADFTKLSLAEVNRVIHSVTTMEIVSPYTTHIVNRLTSRFFPDVRFVEVPLGLPQPVIQIAMERLGKFTRASAFDPFDALHPLPRSATEAPAPPLLAHTATSILVAYAQFAPTLLDVRGQYQLPEQMRANFERAIMSKPMMPVRLVRALCDYYLALMRDEKMVARHSASSTFPLRAWDDAMFRARVDAQVVMDMTNLAWSFVLLNMDKYTFVRHFLYAYVQWVEARFSFSGSAAAESEEDESSTQVVYRPSGQTVAWPKIDQLMRRMHQISIQLLIRERHELTPSPAMMPGGEAAASVPPLPSSFNFSVSLRTTLVRRMFNHHDQNVSVSQFQLQVYHHLRDPDGPMHFRQRVLHERARIMVPDSQKQWLIEREMHLNALDKMSEQHASSSSLPLDAESSWQLRDRLSLSPLAASSSSSVDEHVPEEVGSVDFFVEHTSELGYLLDAAIFMRTNVKDAHPRERIVHIHRKAGRTAADALTKMPAIQAALANHSNACAAIPRAYAPSASSSFGGGEGSYGSEGNDEEEMTLRVALEIDGPWHFCAGTRYYLNASSRLKTRQLRDLGWFTVNIPAFEWNMLKEEGGERAEWIANKLPTRMLKESRRFKQAHEEWKRQQRALRSAPQWLRTRRTSQEELGGSPDAPQGRKPGELAPRPLSLSLRGRVRSPASKT